MSRILHVDDYKVSTTRELQEKIQKQKESEEKQRNALKEYQYKFGKIRGFHAESPQSTTLKPSESTSGMDSVDNSKQATDTFSCTSPTTLESRSSLCCPEQTPSPVGVNRMLDFSNHASRNTCSQAKETKPKLFQNLSFDEPLSKGE